ncbi:MAG TPA: insulinase family protein, partial [Candidatus Peregrinibacteria bacterium]|nr:insulinase family protein [Candidatus Peregrinibacteria bacterium]
MHKYNRTVLENGLRIITSPLKNTQAMTILVLVGAGSRYENKENNGISHFLEHMFFKGAKKYKNTKEVSEAIDGVGGIFNAFTGKEYAGYYVKVAAEEQDTAYDVLSDMMIHSTFHPFEIDKERGVILEEYNMYQDTPMYQIGWDFEKIIFGDQPIGRDQIGTKKLIEAVTQEDFLNYKESLYTTDNTVISIAGNVEHEEAVEKIKKFFQFPEKKKSLSWEKFKNYQTKENTILRNKKTEQGHIVVGVPGYHTTHPDYFAAKVLSVILGGNMSSRMFLSVREAQGLCYYIHTTTDDYNDCGVLSTRAGVDLKRVDQAITAIVKE